MKKILLFEEKLLLLILFLFLGIFLFLSNTFINLETFELKHWARHRDDFVFIYNSLLQSQNLPQNYLDHPSLFTFLIFPFFYKFFFLLGYLDFYDLDGLLIQSNIDYSLNQLLLVSQIAIYLFSCVLIYFFFKIVKKFNGRKLDAFFLTILLFFSTGFLHQTSRIESGLISTTLLMIGFFYLIKFIESKNTKSIFYFSLVIIFVLSAMMQKKLAYFTIPFFFISSIYFLKKNDENIFNFKLINFKYLLFLIYSFVVFLIVAKTFSFQDLSFKTKRDLDFIFLISNFFGFNLLLFFYIKYFQNKNYQNLLVYNALLVGIYFIYQFFLIYLLSANPKVWEVTFSNFIGHLNMFTNGDIKGEFEFISLSVYFKQLINNFYKVFNKYFLIFSYQSLLIYLNLILLIFLIKSLRRKEILTIIFLLSGFIIFQTICNYRYENPAYFIFSEFLLLFSLSILLKKFTINLKYYSFLIIILIPLVFANLDTWSVVSNLNKKNECNLVLPDKAKEDSFFTFFASRLPMETKLKLCLKN